MIEALSNRRKNWIVVDCGDREIEREKKRFDGATVTILIIVLLCTSSYLRL